MLFATKMAHAATAGAVGFLLCDRAVDSREAAARQLSRALRVRGDSLIPAFWISRRAASEWLACRSGGLDDLQARIDVDDESVRCRTHITAQLAVAMDPPPPARRTANVVGVLRGHDPDLAREFVVVGAHHDHLGRGSVGSLGGPAAVGKIHPGADDDASGVAGLLRVARLLADREFRRSIVFAAFGAGEVDLRGSSWFLESGALPSEQIVVMLNLDMIGRAGSGLRLEGVATARGWDDAIDAAVAHSPLVVSQRDFSGRRSDQRPFLRAGVPALLFHTGLHAQFHRPSDTASLVQIDAATRVADLAAEIALVFADTLERPVFESSGEPRGGR